MQLPSGEEIPLPPIILGRLGSDPGKKTVCIYGHLDVQPANIDDGWDTEPFTLVEKEGESPFLVYVCYKITLKPFRYDPESLPVQNKAALLKVTEVDWNSVLACKTRCGVINMRASVSSK